MRYATPIAVSILVLAATSGGSAAHGTRCFIDERTVGLEAVYDDGSPMAFCDVEVFCPASADSARIKGNTDAGGRYAFFPDTAGVWRVTVDDGMGHLASIRIEVASGGKAWSRTGRARGRLSGAVTGVSVIFGLFGLIVLFRRREQTRSAGDAARGGHECI